MPICSLRKLSWSSKLGSIRGLRFEQSTVTSSSGSMPRQGRGEEGPIPLSRSIMSNKLKSLIFDFSQVGSIVFILLTGPVISTNTLLFIFQIASVLILFVAAWEMRRTKYYRVPDLGKQNELVTTGIYKYIRNPMYLSQLLFAELQ